MLRQEEVYIVMCIVHLMCVFHYFKIFTSFMVCVFKGVKNYRPGGWGPLNAGGAIVHCTTCTIHCYAPGSSQEHHNSSHTYSTSF